MILLAMMMGFFRVRIKHKVARVIAMITHVNGNKMSKKGRKIMPVMTNMGKRARDHSNGDKDDKKERKKYHANDEEVWERGLELLPVTKKEEKVHANDEEDEEKREPKESPHRLGPHPLLQGNNTLESFVGNLRHKYYAEILFNILF